MSVLVPPEMFGASGCQGESSHSGLFLLACLSLLLTLPPTPLPALTSLNGCRLRQRSASRRWPPWRALL